jgi:AmiR/NasT family two-component response regulator
MIKKAYRYHDNVAVVTLDSDLVSLNQFDITIDGTAVTPVVFDTDHDTTMTNIKEQIQADIAGAVVTLTDATNNRELTITIEDGVDRVVTAGVTLGASQAGVTIAYSSSMIFEGFSRFEQQGQAQISDMENPANVITAGTSQLEKGDAMASMIHGDITCVVADAVQSKTQAYVVKDGANQGLVTDAVTNNVILPGATIMETTTAAGLADVRINK